MIRHPFSVLIFTGTAALLALAIRYVARNRPFPPRIIQTAWYAAGFFALGTIIFFITISLVLSK